MSKVIGETAPCGDMEGFVGALGGWFEREGRHGLPWRRTVDPYAILVSEVMLQQTQVATVLGRGYYGRWMERFPDVETLAAAGEDEVLKCWEGLGYYRRARNLQAAARVVMGDYGGVFPRELEAILALPGVGRYTAGAVASFAYDDAVPLVDGNVARVFSRLFDFAEEVDGTVGQRQLWAWAEELVVAAGAGRVFNSALMELGQRVCTVRSPVCGECPVAAWCVCEDPRELPVKKARTKVVEKDEHVLWVRDGTGRVLMVKGEERRREGLWRLPERSAVEMEGRGLLLKMKYSIMHYRVTLYVYDGATKERGEGEIFVEVSDVAMASPYRKASEKLKS